MKLLIEANQKREAGEFLKAAELYESLLNTTINPDVMRVLATVYFKLSLERSFKEDWGKRAMYWINRAIETDSTRPEFYVTRGEFLAFGVIDAPDYENASKDYRIALRINPDLVDATLGLASLVGVPDNVVSLEEAITLIEHATTVAPDNGLIWIRLGSLYYEKGQKNKSFEAYQKSLLCSQPIKKNALREIIQHFG